MPAQIRLRTRIAGACAALLAVSLLGAASASAAPRVVSVEGYYMGKDAKADYVVLDIRTSGASAVLVKWRRYGGGYQKVRRGLIGMGFANRGARRFKVRVGACRRGKCRKGKVFKGTFTPRPYQPPQYGDGESGGPGDGAGDGGGLVPELPPLPPVVVPGTPVTPPIPVTGPGGVVPGV